LTYIHTSPSPCLTTTHLAVVVLVKSAYSVVPKLNKKPIGGQRHPLLAAEAFQELRRFGARKALWPRLKPGTIAGKINPAWIKMPNDKAPVVALPASVPQV
jgi:hypothetical protein